MREFVKANMSYWLSQSLFGMQQMINLFTPQGQRRNHPVTEGFNDMARATAETMGTAMGAAFRAGDNIQRGVVDMTFGLLTLGGSNLGGGRAQGQGGGGVGAGRGGGWGQGRQDWSGTASDIGRQTANAFTQGVRAMGQTADVVGQAMGGGSQSGGSQSGGSPFGGGPQGAGGGRQQQRQSTGWGPVPPPPQQQQGGNS